MAVKTQGTQLYFINPASSASVIEVGCVTTLTGISATRDQIETTCLSSAARTYEAGMPTPGTVSFTINFDPDDASHVLLYDLWQAGTALDWALGWSDGTDAPTLDSFDAFDLPTTRTWVTFSGYLSDVPLDFALNTVVTANVSVQLSGFPNVFEKV